MPDVGIVLKEVCTRYGIERDALVAKCRTQRLAYARQEAMYFLRTMGYSYPAIAKFLGGFNHTTIMHGVKAYAERTGLHSPYVNHKKFTLPPLPKTGPLAEIIELSLNWQKEHGAKTHIKPASR